MPPLSVYLRGRGKGWQKGRGAQSHPYRPLGTQKTKNKSRLKSHDFTTKRFVKKSIFWALSEYPFWALKNSIFPIFPLISPGPLFFLIIAQKCIFYHVFFRFLLFFFCLSLCFFFSSFFFSFVLFFLLFFQPKCGATHWVYHTCLNRRLY